MIRDDLYYEIKHLKERDATLGRYRLMRITGASSRKVQVRLEWLRRETESTGADDACAGEKSRTSALKSRIRQLESDLVGMQKHVEAARAAAKREYIQTAPRSRPVFGTDTVRVFIPDLHGSLMDSRAVGAVIEDLGLLDPHEIVLLGDVLECGGFLAQHHTLGYVAQTEYTYEADVAAGNEFLDRVQAAAPRARIHFLEGNHEDRVERWCVTQALRNGKDAEFLRRCVAPEYVLRLEERGISYYRRDRCYDGITIQGTIRLGPPQNYVYATHGITTRKHAAAGHVERFAANVVYGHTHRRDSYTTNTVDTPTIAAHSPGCLCQRQPLYLHTQPESWQHGYGVQIVAASGLFQHTNVLIVDGESLLMPQIKGHTEESA